MELKVNALMLRGVDYKDNDKILTLFSLENGKISVGAKGVKRAGAKLAFCAAPFCFAEYVLNERSDRLTVIGATEIESFYKLRLDVYAYCASAAICEFLLKFTEEGQPEEGLFYLAIKALKAMCFENAEPSAALISFLCEALRLSGYGVNFSSCAACGKNELGERAFFDFSSGKYYCENCAVESALQVLPSTVAALRECAPLLLNGEIDGEVLKADTNSFLYNGETNGDNADGFYKLMQEKKACRVRALAFLNHYMGSKLGEKLKSAVEYAKLANFA